MTTLHTPNKMDGRCYVYECCLPALAVLIGETFSFRENLMKFPQPTVRTGPWCCPGQALLSGQAMSPPLFQGSEPSPAVLRAWDWLGRGSQ